MREPENACLTAALAYGEHGWAILPLHSVDAAGVCSCGNRECGSAGKHPRTRHGLGDAATDPAIIKGWWDRWPDANVAIRTGTESGLVALDIDPRHRGVFSLELLQAEYELLPVTVEARTGGGGRHFLFAHPGNGVKVSCAQRLGGYPGVDIRGDGGYIVAPPSVHQSGERYEWLGDWRGDLAPLPEWLAQSSDGGNGGGDATQPVDATSVLAGVPEGRRDNELFRLACRLRTAEVPQEMAEQLLQEAARNCTPPFSVELARRKVRWVYSHYPPGTRHFEEPERSTLPSIDAQDHDLPRVSGQALEALEGENRPPYMFRHGGLPVRLESDESDYPIPRELTIDRMRHELARVARWYKHSGGSERKRKPALPPVHVVRDVLASPELPFPVLTRIVEVPVFAPDGSLQVDPGYHPATQTYYWPARGFTLPEIPVNPSPIELTEARRFLIEDLLSDFPFTGPAELANAIALLLHPLVRNLIAGATPLHLIEAPTPGTGKTLLTDVLTIPATGRPLTAMTEGQDEDEWRKRVTAKLREGPPFVLIDNLNRKLRSPALCSAITSTEWADRLLGGSEMVRLPVQCAWIATGNNPDLSDEMARRTVRIRIDAQIDRPWLREDFRHPDLRSWALHRRADITAAALTLVRGWFAAGAPRPRISIGMFEEWAGVMGGILEVAGISEFLSNRDELYEQADTEGATLRALVDAWWEEYEDQEVTTSQLWSLIERESVPLDLGRGGDHSQKIRLGRKLSQLRDRKFGDHRCVSVGVHRRAQKWQLTR